MPTRRYRVPTRKILQGRERDVNVECTACDWTERHPVREVLESALLKHYEQEHPHVAEQIRTALRAEIAAQETL